MEAIQKPLDKEVETKLIAFKARTGLNFKDNNTLLNAVTHSSFPQKNNDSPRYHVFGEKVLGMYVTEYVMAQYPLIPAEVVSSIVDAYVGSESLASLGKLFGVQYVMRWKVD